MALNGRVSLNMSIRGLNKSPTLFINEQSRTLQSQGRRVYRLGLGQSPFPVPPPVVDSLKEHAHEKDYLPVEGLRELRGAVAHFHRQKDGLNVQPQHTLIGPGSKELMFLLQLVFYGEIYIPTPCWVSYVPQARIIGRSVQTFPTSFDTRWRTLPEQLDETFESEQDTYRPRLLVLNYPSNPDGGTFKPEELQAIAEVARKYEVIVLSDEIYGQLHYKGEHISIARYYPERTIISSGLSKWCGAGGWRLGTFSFPPNLSYLLEAISAVASETYTSVSAPIQYAAVKAFQGGLRIERYLWHIRRILDALATCLTEILTQAGIRCHKPDGAFYLFPDFTPLAEKLSKRGITDSADLCHHLLNDTGVAILPGADFQRPPSELTARLAFVNFNGAEALAASETIPLDQPLPASFVTKWCGNTVEAVERLADWTSG